MQNYLKFILMIIVSTIIMFGLMYLNSYSLDHIFYSETRFYMTLIMGASMAIVMLTFMRSMYLNNKTNFFIYGISSAIIIMSIFLVRSQNTIDDISWMKAMIPHHSIAILTSERARIADPRVRKLAENIIQAQRKEIAEMKFLIKDLEKNQTITSK